jgi:hypothetical protein
MLHFVTAQVAFCLAPMIGLTVHVARLTTQMKWCGRARLSHTPMGRLKATVWVLKDCFTVKVWPRAQEMPKGQLAAFRRGCSGGFRSSDFCCGTGRPRLFGLEILF